MKKFALAFLLMFSFAGYASAGCSDITVYGMSKADVETLRLECQKKMVDKVTGVTPAATAEDTMKKWSAYGNFAKEVAESIGVLAKELNMEINSFLKTDAGKLAAALLIWKIFGEGIADFLALLVLVPASIWVTSIVMRKFWRKEWEEKTVKGWFGSEKTIRRPIYERFYDLSDGEQLWVLLPMIGCAIFNAIFILTHI